MDCTSGSVAILSSVAEPHQVTTQAPAKLCGSGTLLESVCFGLFSMTCSLFFLSMVFDKKVVLLHNIAVRFHFSLGFSYFKGTVNINN
jgi:hypothetical protein